VSHSLGTVIAFKTLKEMARGSGWKVPLFVTLGSPLAVTTLRKPLLPIKYPVCVDKWFNAMDARDVVSLYPLERANFKTDPEDDNKTDVNNLPTTGTASQAISRTR